MIRLADAGKVRTSMAELRFELASWLRGMFQSVCGCVEGLRIDKHKVEGKRGF
jgi:uncharacterized membrane protein AbrB (regulator of aidB expression)